MWLTANDKCEAGFADTELPISECFSRTQIVFCANLTMGMSKARSESGESTSMSSLHNEIPRYMPRRCEGAYKLLATIIDLSEADTRYCASLAGKASLVETALSNVVVMP